MIKLMRAFWVLSALLVLPGLSFLSLLSPPLRASDIGMSVNGVCYAGSCPADSLAFSGSDTLPFDVNYTLNNGDMFNILGSFSDSENSGGTEDFALYDFQVTYEGNGQGGPSQADAITVGQYVTFGTVLSSGTFGVIQDGAFGPGLDPSSSASSCVNVSLGCTVPAYPPGTFYLTNSFSPESVDGTFVYNQSFTSNFGAGSAVGSYIVWGQDTAFAPEPVTAVLFLAGFTGILLLRSWCLRAAR